MPATAAELSIREHGAADPEMDFTDEQIIELLDYARMYQQSGRHALAADAYRRAGQALEMRGKSTLARWCWQELDTELAHCELQKNHDTRLHLMAGYRSNRRSS